MIQRYFKEPGFQDPKQPLYSLVASNGCFLVRNTVLFSSVTEAPVPGLEPQRPSLTLHFGKLPREVMEKALGFFRWAWKTHGSEAIVLLFYNPKTRLFHVQAPPQTVHYAMSVKYTAIERPAGFLSVGDIHSHGGGMAHFSGTDDEDDKADGLRLVMGYVDKANPDICCSFIAGGTRFRVPVEDAAEDFHGVIEPPDEWKSQLTKTGGFLGKHKEERAPYSWAPKGGHGWLTKRWHGDTL